MVEIPVSLLQPFPISDVKDNSVRALTEAYIENTIQLGNANKRLNTLRDWNERQIIIYSNNGEHHGNKTECNK